MVQKNVLNPSTKENAVETHYSLNQREDDGIFVHLWGGTESSSDFRKKEDPRTQGFLLLVPGPVNQKEHFRATKRNHTSRRECFLT